MLLALRALSLLTIVTALLSAAPAPTQQRRDALKKQFHAGNFKDAYDGYRAMTLDKDDDPLKVGEDLTTAITLLAAAGASRRDRRFPRAVIDVHKSNWRLLQTAAQSYINSQLHYGYIVAGKFYRGNQRGGGEFVGTDRARPRAGSATDAADAMGQMKTTTTALPGRFLPRHFAGCC